MLARRRCSRIALAAFDETCPAPLKNSCLSSINHEAMVRYRVFNLFASLCVDGDERRPRVLVEAQWGPTTSSTLRYVGFAPPTASSGRRSAAPRRARTCANTRVLSDLAALPGEPCGAR